MTPDGSALSRCPWPWMAKATPTLRSGTPTPSTPVDSWSRSRAPCTTLLVGAFDLAFYATPGSNRRGQRVKEDDVKGTNCSIARLDHRSRTARQKGRVVYQLFAEARFAVRVADTSAEK